MAKPDFFPNFFFGPPKGSLPEKNLPWGTSGLAILIALKNQPEKLSRLFFTYWEPKKVNAKLTQTGHTMIKPFVLTYCEKKKCSRDREKLL